MSQVLIQHTVKDYNQWKTAFDNFSDFRKTSGEKSYRILHADDNRNDLTLIFDWDTKKNAEAFLNSQELKTTMQEAGVAEAPKIQFLSQITEGKL